MKALLKPLVAVLCLVGSFFAIYNVQSDVAPIQAQAEQVACPKGCAQLLGMTRTPIKNTFTFQVESNSAQTKTIDCERSMILVGEYSCAPAP